MQRVAKFIILRAKHDYEKQKRFDAIPYTTPKMAVMSLFLLWIVQITRVVGREHHLGQGSPRERSPVGSRISKSLFLDVPGKATEQVRTCGFRRNSSSFDKAPKIHDSVRLNSLESFSVSLLSICSETRDMYSWTIPGSSFLWLTVPYIFWCFSRNCCFFLLFLNVAMILREKFC